MNLTEKQVRRALVNVKATLAVEGLKPSKATLRLGRSYLQGKITSQEAISAITHRIISKKERLQKI